MQSVLHAGLAPKSSAQHQAMERAKPGTMESTPGSAVLSIACLTALTAASCVHSSELRAA